MRKRTLKFEETDQPNVIFKVFEKSGNGPDKKCEETNQQIEIYKGF